MDRKRKQVSESMVLGIVLALSGGLMDAYSYLWRGHVYANAQTGNVILFSLHLSSGELLRALSYLAPILAFSAGIACSEAVRYINGAGRTLHWRQWSVLLEAAVLIAVGFMPQQLNLPANSLTSFACGIQVESFRKINGNGIATTMCIGNMRSAMQGICDFFYQKDRSGLRRSGLYYTIIFAFALGAVLGNFCIGRWGGKAIFVSAALLLFAFLIMFFSKEEKDGPVSTQNDGKKA